jgi:hypothetical protein
MKKTVTRIQSIKNLLMKKSKSLKVSMNYAKNGSIDVSIIVCLHKEFVFSCGFPLSISRQDLLCRGLGVTNGHEITHIL